MNFRSLGNIFALESSFCKWFPGDLKKECSAERHTHLRTHSPLAFTLDMDTLVKKSPGFDF